MRRQAVITAVDGKRIEAVALLSEVCVHCPSDCGRRGKPFLVVNRHRLPLQVGDTVRVYHSRLVRGISGITALCGPVLCALLGYLLAPHFARAVGLPLAEPFRALCVLAGIVLPAAAIFIVNRSNLHLFKPEITQVL